MSSMWLKSRKLITLSGISVKKLVKTREEWFPTLMTPLGCPCFQKYLHSHPRRSLLVEPLRYWFRRRLLSRKLPSSILFAVSCISATYARSCAFSCSSIAKRSDPLACALILSAWIRSSLSSLRAFCANEAWWKLKSPETKKAERTADAAITPSRFRRKNFWKVYSRLGVLASIGRLDIDLRTSFRSPMTVA